MKIRTLAFSAQALALGALLATPALCVAADTPGGKATAKDVSRKADETSRAIKGYTVAQRDEAVTQAKAALDDVDARIRRMERKLDGEWDKMDGAARKKSRAALNALRRERGELAEWYGGLKHSSAESWEQVKAGFVKSYEVLRKSFAKARKEL
ncbi:MAG: hypothetical protein E6H42_11675 [Betaproteobacteria bacterium]|nr:MAG: hypothetical protein E6H45_00175 [Betaproteobacteria bacterium]TMH91093.1 MAG: hypothetical protein E6H42_11675 [Betaproteobacteria bacterium]